MRVGVDIVQISQVKKIKKLERFLMRFYAPEEIKYIASKNTKKEQTIAGIFAGKEAFLKALELGIGKIQLQKVVVGHNENNAPFIVMNDEVKSVLKKYGYSQVDLSISHGGNYAVAFCNLS